jgi:hypothetical protein
MENIMKDSYVPVLERQVSLIMTLGRVVYLFQSYGPPPPDDRFAEHMVDKIPDIESDFRKTNDFEKLEKDLWYIRCIAKQYDDFVREYTKQYDHLGEEAFELLPGHSIASGKDRMVEGEYTFHHCPYAGELGEFPSYGLRMADGEWKDPHEGWKDLDLYDGVMNLLNFDWLNKIMITR